VFAVHVLGIADRDAGFAVADPDLVDGAVEEVSVS